MLKLTKEKSYTFPLRSGYESMSLVARTEELAVLSPSISSELKTKLRDILEDISIMLIKMPSSQLTKSVQFLFNNNHANVSFRKDNNSSPDRVPRINSHITFIGNNHTVGYISADANSVAITYDLDKSNIDIKKAVYSYYHGLIRAAVLTSSSSNINNLRTLVSDFYIRLFKHVLDLSSLTELQEFKFNFVVAKFVSLTLFKQNNGASESFASSYLKGLSNQDRDTLSFEIDNISSMFKSAATMKDIFSVFQELSITYDNSSAAITKTYNALSVNNYLSVMSSSLDIVISSIIMSKYSKDYFSLNVDNTITIGIESSISKLIQRIKYGSVPNVS